ncbi:hypothetical protein BKA93DRAFT_736379 [Sparassis latifolia]
MPIVFPTPISIDTAHAFAAFFTFSYVGSLYVSKNARLSFKKKTVPKLKDGEQRAKERDERWRDDPEVIRARLVAVGTSTVLSCGAVFLLIWENVGSGPGTFRIALESTLARLGLFLDFSHRSPYAIVLPCLTAPALFLGPLFAEYLASALPFQRRWSIRFSVLPIFATWQGWRNYIVGPITEEVVFRACTLAVYHLAGVSRNKMVFLSPLTFGAAHLHHAWDTFNRYGRTGAAARRALVSSVFQLAYTCMFGFHCAFLFLRTGSLIPPIVSHIFCNIMGIPQYGLHITHFPRRRTAIKFAYILGIAGYVYAMCNWTLADDSLYWPPLPRLFPRY